MNIHAPPDHNQLPSEQYRLAARSWVELDGAARMLEECKTAVLAQRQKAMGDMPAAHSEREVKASPEWEDFIRKMVDARTAANLARVRMKWTEMKFSEWLSMDATKRAEMKL